VLNITNTFDSSFSRWTVGLGIEHQLNELRVAAGLAEEARFRARARNLDYAQLVHPEVSLRTPQCSVVASITWCTLNKQAHNNAPLQYEVCVEVRTAA